MHHGYDDKPSGYYGDMREELLPFVPESVVRWLDVGCSGGGFGKAIKLRHGAEVWGVEAHESAAKEASTHLDRVLEGPLEQYLGELSGQDFDGISFNDVLEHLVDPWGALKSVRSLLSPNGIVLASIPNVLHKNVVKELIFEQDWRYRDDGVLDQTHLRFFTRKSICRMFEQCGYQILHVEGINRSKTRNRFDYFNWFFLGGRLSDSQFLQFAVLAKPIEINQ